MRSRSVLGAATLVGSLFAFPFLAAPGSGLGPAVASASQAAPGITSVGWWTRRPTAAAQALGGFEVADGPQGTTSLAALRVFVGSGTRVTLVLSESAAPSGTAALDVCVTTSGWVEANPGAFADAPVANCAGAVHLARDTATGAWSADVTAIAIGGSKNLMVVPVATPIGGLVDPGQTVTFSGAHLTVEGAVEENPTHPDPAAPPSPPPTTTPASDPGSGATDPGFGSIAPSDPAVVLGGSGGSAPIDPAATDPAKAAPPTTVDPAGPSERVNVPLPSGVLASGVSGGGRPWWRLVVFLPLAALFGFGSVLARKFAADRLATRLTAD